MKENMVAFDIKGSNGRIKLEIVEVYGFPEMTSFRGGYDIRCKLTINVGVYSVSTENYFSCTGALNKFYLDLQTCYKSLNGVANYKVDFPENELKLNLNFKDGKVFIVGSYRDDVMNNNMLNFEFNSDQSYFANVLKDLKKVFEKFENKNN